MTYELQITSCHNIILALLHHSKETFNHVSVFCLNSALLQRQAKEPHNTLPDFELYLFCDFLGMIYPAVGLLPEEISFK